MSSSADHSALVNAILADCGSLPGVVIGANASGRAVYMSATGRRFRVPYGWPHAKGGGPDLLAVVAPLGRMVALECKTGEATTTKAQRECHAALRAVGVAVHVVRSVEQARAALLAVVDQAGELAEVAAGLGDDERRVLLAIARRLAIGRKAYGPLDVQGDRRDWRSEGAEELLDGCVYLACEAMRRP